MGKDRQQKTSLPLELPATRCLQSIIGVSLGPDSVLLFFSRSKLQPGPACLPPSSHPPVCHQSFGATAETLLHRGPNQHALTLSWHLPVLKGRESAASSPETREGGVCNAHPAPAQASAPEHSLPPPLCRSPSNASRRTKQSSQTTVFNTSTRLCPTRQGSHPSAPQAQYKGQPSPVTLGILPSTEGWTGTLEAPAAPGQAFPTTVGRGPKGKESLATGKGRRIQKQKQTLSRERCWPWNRSKPETSLPW